MTEKTIFACKLFLPLNISVFFFFVKIASPPPLPHHLFENLVGGSIPPAENLTNTKIGSVCIYYHNSLPLKVIDIQLLNECINFEIRIRGNCAASFVYIDHLVKLKISLKHLLIILS